MTDEMKGKAIKDTVSIERFGITEDVVWQMFLARALIYAVLYVGDQIGKLAKNARTD